ncbi:MAG TPA: response regulator transcription factor, partial [Elusimicrobiales bacterium]|nr:response regulator transcription factor [Elusimicrobiales bacterium]
MQKKILIVDDDKDLLDVLGRYLRDHGFSTTAARDGAEGLAVIKDFRPDVVITDAQMPGMDGFAFCRKLRENRASASIPVIIMSGKKTTESDILSGYDRGTDDYVIKPFSYPVLLAKIGAVIRRAGAGARPAKQVFKKFG